MCAFSSPYLPRGRKRDPSFVDTDDRKVVSSTVAGPRLLESLDLCHPGQGCTSELANENTEEPEHRFIERVKPKAARWALGRVGLEVLIREMSRRLR
jgi:hypothetical protein